jgi:hypothetical protein
LLFACSEGAADFEAMFLKEIAGSHDGESPLRIVHELLGMAGPAAWPDFDAL